uniref:Metalloendopeptidase n=1 Tax=Oulactis sp. TaxID=2093647 RepID=A0A4U8YVD9_OULSP|nr:mRNA [Oulactis sp. MM-2018]
MVRLELIVLLALQVFLVTSFPADGVSNQTAKTNLTALNMSGHVNRGEHEEEKLGNSHVFEGDIYKDRSTTDILHALQSGAARDAVTNVIRLWPGGRVPYVFGRTNSRLNHAFQQAIDEYKKHTCIRIVPRTTEKDYIYVFSGAGCYSAIAKSDGRQRLSLGRGCEEKGTAIHELMHALGFFHEQSRMDRDKYVTIHWKNIIYGERYNFKKYSHGQADTLGEPYDYDSIMHYVRKAFSRNGRDTVVPTKSGVTIGQRRGLSRIDIRQINKLYNCGGSGIPTRPPTMPPTKPGPCKDEHSECPKWAQRGDCVKGSHVEYMKSRCKKSCGLCRGIETKCFDVKSSCPKWVRGGFCKSYASYMREYCSKSCNMC